MPSSIPSLPLSIVLIAPLIPLSFSSIVKILLLFLAGRSLVSQLIAHFSDLVANCSLVGLIYVEHYYISPFELYLY